MIAIPNIEKPQNCAECPMGALSEFSGIVCKLNRNNGKSNCPLIDIVQCKECKWGDTGIDEKGELVWKCIGIHYGGTKPTDFCSYGERRG